MLKGSDFYRRQKILILDVDLKIFESLNIKETPHKE
jgi:hypothetical protein